MRNSSIIRNASSLLTAHLASRILAFALTILLPRYLEGGFHDLGKYFVALWLANLLATIMELGLYTPLIREVAADRSKAPQIITNALAIRLILSIVNLLIIVVLSKLLYSGELAPLIYILGLSEIINALTDLFRRLFRAFERMGFEALSFTLERLAVFLLGLCAVIRGYGIIGFSVVILAVSIFNLIATFLIMVYKFSKPSFRLLDVKLCNALLKQALPFALGGVLSIVYFRIDGLVLKYIMGPDGDLAMGWYGTGYSLVNALTIIPGAFMGAVFPVMSRIIICRPLLRKPRLSHPKHRKNVKLKDSTTSAIDFLYTKSFKLMFTIALPIAVGMTFLAHRIVLIFYPTGRFALQDQEALIWILRILIWSGALIFLNTVLITVFRAANKRRAFLVIMAVVVFANIGFNLFLIPRYGHIGPAISMVISESLLFASGLWYVQSHVCKLSEFGFLFKTVFASGFLALGLFFWEYAPGFGRDIHIALTVCIAAIVYFAVILALKGLKREDIALVKGRF